MLIDERELRFIVRRVKRHAVVSRVNGFNMNVATGYLVNGAQNGIVSLKNYKK